MITKEMWGSNEKALILRLETMRQGFVNAWHDVEYYERMIKSAKQYMQDYGEAVILAEHDIERFRFVDIQKAEEARQHARAMGNAGAEVLAAEAKKHAEY